MSVKTLANWVAKAKRDQLPMKRRVVGPVDDVQAELARLRQEVVTLRTEKEILKKAAAYFARESL